jgi:hypothetical protein
MNNTKVGGRHSAADWKTIKATRKAGHDVANMAKAIVAYMQELGDDGLDDDEDKYMAPEEDDESQQQDAKALQIESGQNTPETNSNALAGDSGGQESTSELYPHIKSVEDLTNRQRYIVGDLLEIVADMGQFSQGIDSEGAHYIPAMQNTFAASGIMCEECVFYSPAGACAIVAGRIESYAACKFWVVPNNVLASYLTVPAIEQPEAEMPEEEMPGEMMNAEKARVDTQAPHGIISETTREFFRQVLDDRN